MNVSSGVAVHPSSAGDLFVNLTGLTACDLQPDFPSLRLTTKVSPQPPSSPLGPSRVSTLDRPRVSNLEQSTVENFDQLIPGASDSSLMRQIADLNVENTRLKLLLARSSQSTELGATPSWKNVVVRDKNVSGVGDKESSAARNAGRMKLEFFPPTVENNRIVVSPPEQIEQIGQSKWEKCIVGHFLDKKLGFTANYAGKGFRNTIYKLSLAASIYFLWRERNARIFQGRARSVTEGAATTCYVALHPQVKGVSGEYFSDSNLAKPIALAKDEELAKKLWDFSLSLTVPSDGFVELIYVMPCEILQDF
ncbi:hypothetical protein RHMOL_Rhmol02G0291100 [Rhododendron molle]|nr:hypothetical protein RHMOL_Rhmol02G0291100 [Rhododendron molle]